MARMKTGRLTTMTTPPDKYIITSKRETVQPRQLTDKEKKYNADEAAYSKYQSESAKYASEKAKFDKGNFGKMNTASKDYNAVFGGKQNMRKLNSTELAIWNADVKKNNPDLPEGYDVEIPKSVKAGEGSSFKPDKVMAYHTNYKAPTAPNKVNPPNSNDMPLDRLPGIKITSIKSKGGSAPKARKEAAEKAEFSNPPKKAGSNAVSMNPLAGGAKTKGAGKRYVKQVVASVGGPNNRGYNKEEKRFKAYAGTTATGDSFVDMTPSEIRNYRSQAKSTRAEYRKQPDSDLKSMGKAAMTSEIRQSRKAEKFAKQVYNTSGKEKSVKFFNDKNYGGNIVKDYRESSQNAANRNTMEAKIKAAGTKAKSRAASFNGQMPL